MTMLIDILEIGQQLTKVSQEARYDLPSETFDIYQLEEISGSEGAEEVKEELIMSNLSFKEVAMYATGLAPLPYPEI